jgi:hypothetical protein
VTVAAAAAAAAAAESAANFRLSPTLRDDDVSSSRAMFRHDVVNDFAEQFVNMTVDYKIYEEYYLFISVFHKYLQSIQLFRVK